MSRGTRRSPAAAAISITAMRFLAPAQEADLGLDDLADRPGDGDRMQLPAGELDHRFE